MGFFNPSSPSSPISSPTVSTNITDAMPLSSSPRHSATLPRSSLSKTNVDIPKPRANEESPDIFLGRLEEAVSKAEIANVLAGNGDPFYSQALQVYIDRFDFTNDPLDIALRKLLMDVGLPKETQQIDRVMEAFAASYTKCNPGLFMSEDHPYILAFSLIMLHTDAFNKSNKRKMSKPDYIKNTKLVGVSAEVLDYFYDNTVFAPFIFIEDPVDVNGQRGLFQDGRTQSSSSGQATPTASGSGLSMLGKSNKIDPYYLITRNLLGPLRIEVESHIPLRNPYSYQGTAGSWNEGELRRSFARADVIEVDTMDAKRMSTLPFFSMNVSGAPGPMITSFAGQTVSEPESSLSELSTLRVTKVGLLNRKDDVSDGGKRASSRKWREWSVILTGSQLLFFRDSAMALDLIAQSHSSENKIFSAQFSFLRPDEHVSVKDAIAVYDSSYAKHGNVVRLVMATGRQILLQAESEIQRNEWIAHINYTSAFKTAGIRMRPVSATEEARMDAGSYTLDAMRIPSDLSGSASDVVYKDEDKNMTVPSRQAPNGDAINLRVHLSSPDETSKTQSRSKIVLSKIHEFEMKIKTTRAQLDSDIRVVRNLAVLTPFQRTTRDRLQASVINLSRHIKQLRLEVVKTACYRDVLAADLASEDRERRRSRKDVLEAEDHVRKTNSHIPKMTLSVHEDDLRSQSLPHSDMTDSRPESSICESFHSALDFGSDWPLNVRLHASPQSKTKQSFESSSPLPTPSCEIGPDSIKTGFFPPTILDKISARPSLSSSPTLVSSRSLDGNPSFEETHRSGLENVDQEITEEQAEEWDKTRAGRRVSLVRVPIGLRASRHDKERRRHNMRTESDYNDTKLSGDDVISDV
ncbi:hypothetical protein DFH11DRAFT_1500603 [Phellopilus nigrolimitatus]|nr:hypothetical protein DFH11DRAFT_1500603 [Phellopilus nigrolimitatus]